EHIRDRKTGTRKLPTKNPPDLRPSGLLLRSSAKGLPAVPMVWPVPVSTAKADAKAEHRRRRRRVNDYRGRSHTDRRRIKDDRRWLHVNRRRRRRRRVIGHWLV